MTTIQFVPPPRSTFQFQPTLDGQTYSVEVVWSLFGRRWYVNVRSLDGQLVCNVPLIGSPIGVDMQSLTWENGRAVATTALPHGFRTLDTIALTIINCTPIEYNGDVRAFAATPTKLTWPLAANPGEASMLGHIDFNINIVGGYFTTSKLVYREALQQFEISP